MKKKSFVAVALLIIFSAAGLIVARHIYAKPHLQGKAQSSSTAKQDDVPDQVFYGEVFSIIAELKNVRDYQERAQLTDQQTEFLRVTAEQCAEKIAKQDAIAEKRIAALRQQNLKNKPPRLTPPIPKEIGELQAQRDAIILHCRDEFGAGLGIEKFEQFRLAAKSLVQIHVSRAQ